MNYDILNKLRAAKTEGERERLVMGFILNSLPLTLQDAVWAAAIPHWFDADFLTYLLGDQLNDSDFQSLIKLSFIEVFSENQYNIHERTRELLLNELWQNDQNYFLKLSKRASDYCTRQDQNDTHWRIETIYHSLTARQDNAENDFFSQATKWYNFPFDKVEALSFTISKAAENELISGTAAAWAFYFQGAVDIVYSKTQKAIQHLKAALEHKTKNHALTAKCFKSLGDAHLMIKEYAQARKCYEAAQLIYNDIGNRLDEANCIKALDDVNKKLFKYDRDQKRYEPEPPRKSFKGIGDLSYICVNHNCSFPGTNHFEMTFKSEYIMDENNTATLFCPFCGAELMLLQESYNHPNTLAEDISGTKFRN